MRALGIGLVVALGVAGCSSPPPASCDSSNCTGCCTSAGQCVSGNANDLCGGGGAACDVCVTGQTCNAGTCGGSSGGGAGGGTGGGTGGGGSGGGTAKAATFPDLAGGTNGRFPTLMIDSGGTRHLLYQPISGPVRYGECGAHCTASGSWQFATIGDTGTLGGFAKLALTPQGKPRAVWMQTPGMNDPDTLYFGTCDSNCTTAAGWSSGPIKTFPTSEYNASTVGRHLAVDGTGRVHLVYSTSLGLSYVTCASGCTQAASWSAPVKLAGSRGRVSLAATSGGALKLAYTTLLDQNLVYRTCDGSCDQAASWSPELALWPSIEGQVSLRLDAQARPRMFFNENGGGGRHLSLYTWCDANCGAKASWQTVTVGLGAADGKRGLDFDLHADGAVSAAYETEGAAMAVVKCPSGCQTTSGSWTRDVREDGDMVKADMSPPLPAVCSTLTPPKTPFAYWYPGEDTAVAVNPVTNQLEVAYRAYTLEKCGPSGNPVEGVTIPRYSVPD